MLRCKVERVLERQFLALPILLVLVLTLLNLSSWCLVMVERLFLAVPRGCLQFVIVVFPDYIHLLFLKTMNCSLYFGVVAKPGIAKDLIEPDDIGRKAVADFFDILLVENLTLTI